MSEAGDFSDPKGDFELMCSARANDLIPVRKYRSKKTGITVVLAQVEGPVVNGYYCVATEAFDDDGLPHTLEHLVFMGSEQYPYKGVLDLLANRCLASGTNAWTDTDHTCYTMTTAGSQGFLTLMPIYLDHILYPTLSDAAFNTEVHHVNGQGEDAGVVYCEMQGKENMGESLTHVTMLRSIYPGQCGYKSVTGGILKNLRESCSNEKVKKYHSDFYRPENLCLIITGQVEAHEVFDALEPFQNRILSKGLRDGFQRPWQSPVPPLEKSEDILVPYACDEEDNGMVVVAWRGPSAVSELTEMFALMMLMEYLTDTSVSPLQKDFVEIEDPYASSVAFSCIENSVTTFFLYFENVPVAKIDSVKGDLAAKLQAIAADPASLDMKRMDSVIHRKILEQLSNLEISPHESVACMVIGDVLYGRNQADLYQRLNQVEDLQKFRSLPASYWVELLKRYMIDAPSVTVRGRPSLEEMERTMTEEKKRVEAQREKLGPEGLEGKTQALVASMQENELEPPESLIQSVAVPGTASIKFHPITTYTSLDEKQHPKFPLDGMPMFVRLDDVHTNFIYLMVLIDTSCIPRKMKPYLPLLTEALMETAVRRGDGVIPYEDVVAELARDTLQFTMRLGLDLGSRFTCGAYAQTVSVLLQVEVEKYERGVEWLQELLFNSVFTTERLKVLATKMVNDVAQLKRRGNKIAHFLMRDMCYGKDSNHYNSSLMRQLSFLNKLCDELDSSNANQVIETMGQVRKLLTQPDNMMLHLAMGVDKVSKSVNDLHKVWKEKVVLWGQPWTKKSLTVVPDHHLLTPASESPTGACVIGLGSVESSFLVQTVPSISCFKDPDFPALLVFIQYLTQLEGPLWRQIRGQGLAYGYGLNIKPNEGLLYLSLYRSTHVVAAYSEAHRIITAHLSGEELWNETVLESAKSSLIFELIEHEKSVGDIIIQSLLSYFKGIDPSYYRNLLQLVTKVSGEDLSRVGVKYVTPLLDIQASRTAIVCHTSKVDEVVAGFAELGRELTVCASLEDSFLSKW